jgi:hypothetical protein
LILISAYTRRHTADRQNTSLINRREVDSLPRSGAGLALSISDPHNPQPKLSDPISEYLYGTQPTYETSKRGEVKEQVYGIWVDRGRGIVVSLPFRGRGDMFDFGIWLMIRIYIIGRKSAVARDR